MPPTTFPSRKISPPINHQGIVRRERLLRIFQESRKSELVLVSAPAGYGKTTLLANWAKECGHPAAWLSLDKGDNDESQFWQLIIEAIRTVSSSEKPPGEQIGFGELTLNMIEAKRVDDLDIHRIEKVISCLINEIENLKFKSFWLILDDYHEINNKFIHHGLSYFLKYRPAFLNIAIGTRSDPPISLEKMRACDQIIEIRGDNLQFTQEEACIYLNESSELDLTSDEIILLVERTEGWISALQLVVSALCSNQDSTSIISEFSGEFDTIAGFLASEVFDSQPGELRKFLLHTSILDRLTGPLCNALTERIDSQQVLQRMRFTNIPIDTLDKNQNFFQYQQLFSDMLRQRLRNDDPEKYMELQSRASLWFEVQALETGEHELLVIGIQHAIESRDFQRVAELLDQHALHLVSVGFESMLINWIDHLPIELSLPNPVLSAYRLYSLLASGDISKAERHISKAAQYLDGFTEDSPRSSGDDERDDCSIKRGMLDALRAHVSAHGDDLDRSIQYGNTALKLLPDSEPFWKAISMLAVAGANMMKGDFNKAELFYEQASSFSSKQGSPYLVSVTEMKYLGCLFYRGAMARIESIYENTRSHGFSSRLSKRLYGGILDSKYSQVLCEFNRLDQALTHAKIGIDKSEQFENYYVLPISWLSMIQVQYSMANLEGMNESVVKLEQISRHVVFQPWIENQLLAWKIRSMIAQDRISMARASMDQRGIEIKPETNFIAEEINLAHARLLFAEQRFSEGLRLLDRLKLDALKGGRTRKVVEIHALQACGLVQTEELTAALETLEAALSIAEPFDYLRIFLDEGEQLINLLRKAVETKQHPEYAKRIIQAYYDSSETKSCGEYALINPLSQREADVLALLEQRMTNDEIAVKLVISTTTVRTHLRSIFRKLNVHRRWDAVERARELNLLKLR